MLDSYWFEIEYSTDKKKWDDGLLKNKNSMYFQTHDYITNYYNSSPVFVYIYSDDVGIAAQCGFTLRDKRLTCVHAPVIHTEDHNAVMIKFFEAIRYITKHNDIEIIDGYTVPNCNISNLLTPFFKLEKYVTFQLSDFRKENFRKSIRYDIDNADCEFKEVYDLADFNKIVKEWGNNKKKPVRFDEKPNPVERYFVAYHNNIPVSGLRIGVFNKTAHVNQVVNNYKQKNYGTALMFWVMNYLNYPIFDISGIKETELNSSLGHFKSKWGGQKLEYHHFIKILKPRKYKIKKLLSKLFN